MFSVKPGPVHFLPEKSFPVLICWNAEKKSFRPMKINRVPGGSADRHGDPGEAPLYRSVTESRLVPRRESLGFQWFQGTDQPSGEPPQCPFPLLPPEDPHPGLAARHGTFLPVRRDRACHVCRRKAHRRRKDRKGRPDDPRQVPRRRHRKGSRVRRVARLRELKQ